MVPDPEKGLTSENREIKNRPGGSFFKSQKFSIFFLSIFLGWNFRPKKKFFLKVAHLKEKMIFIHTDFFGFFFEFFFWFLGFFGWKATPPTASERMRATTRIRFCAEKEKLPKNRKIQKKKWKNQKISIKSSENPKKTMKKKKNEHVYASAPK